MKHSAPPLACKICGAPSAFRFGLPRSKKTGHEIPNEPDNCSYFECSKCGFLFTPVRDTDDHTKIYDEDYWKDQDPDWDGRVSQTLRLVLLANSLLKKSPDEIEILDFGCGMGCFIEVARRDLQMKVWGTDIIRSEFGKDFFLPALEKRKFDVIVACEVIEHLPDPMGTFKTIIDHLTPEGVFAFQTAYWDTALDRTWWYLGPGNGHISHYAPGSFDIIFNKLNGKERRIWNNYPGIQAWRFDRRSLWQIMTASIRDHSGEETRRLRHAAI
jgi:SAM-dependent methyltransferase